MFISSRSARAFTLIEMLVVMAVIAILAGIILSVNGLVQSKAARTRADVEIRALSAGCESYKADNGSYPQNDKTDALDPQTEGDPNSGKNYKDASQFLYGALSGDTNFNGRNEPAATPAEGKNYIPDFFTPQRLGVSTGLIGSPNWVLFIKDPYGNSYGYSTIAAKDEQDFRVEVAKDAKATRKGGKGYNSSFDLWSTAGKNRPPSSDPTIVNVWVKNW